MRPSEPIAGRGTASRRTRRLLTVAACSTLLGCGATDPSIDQLTAAQHFATRAWPALARCYGCHATQPSIDFLAPGTADGAYATILGFQPPIVDIESPSSSLVLTMGKHTGPALAPPEADAVLGWLEAEREVRIPEGGAPVEIGPVVLALGMMTTVDLGRGATLRFVPAPAAVGLSLTHLALAAGDGPLHVVHPLFASHPRVGPLRVDADDIFGDLDVVLAAHQVELLGGGAALFATFAVTDPITIDFRTLEAP